MTAIRTIVRLVCPLLACCVVGRNVNAAEPAGQIVWHAETRHMDADIVNWPLRRVLERLATDTGWEIHCPEHVQRNVSVRFKNLPVSDAVGRFLGNLNYATLPTTNGVQLLIYEPGTAATNATAKIVARPTAPEIQRPASPGPGKSPASTKASRFRPSERDEKDEPDHPLERVFRGGENPASDGRASSPISRGGPRGLKGPPSKTKQPE